VNHVEEEDMNKKPTESAPDSENEKETKHNEAPPVALPGEK